MPCGRRSFGSLGSQRDGMECGQARMWSTFSDIAFCSVQVSDRTNPHSRHTCLTCIKNLDKNIATCYEFIDVILCFCTASRHEFLGMTFSYHAESNVHFVSGKKDGGRTRIADVTAWSYKHAGAEMTWPVAITLQTIFLMAVPRHPPTVASQETWRRALQVREKPGRGAECERVKGSAWLWRTIRDCARDVIDLSCDTNGRMRSSHRVYSS